MSLSELKKLLKDGVEIIETDYGSVWLGEDIEIYFQSEVMARARFKFWDGEKMGNWLKLVNLSWLEYLGKLSFEEVKNILEKDKTQFKSIEYDNGELGILSSTPHAQFIMFFGAGGVLN